MGDKISVYGTILIFSCLAFAHIEKSIQTFLDRERPNNSQQKALSSFNREKIFLIIKTLVIILFCAGIWYLTVPDSIEIISNYTFDAYNFEEIETCYIIISLLLITMPIILVVRLISLFKK